MIPERERLATADKIESTVRSRLLLRALDCINANDYDDQRDYIIFGKELNEIMDEAGISESETEHSPDRASLRELVSVVKVGSGRDQAARRTTLSKPSQTRKVRGLDKLSNEGLRSVVEIATRPLPSGPSVGRESKALDELDAHFTHEVLSKVPKIVSRAYALDELVFDDINNQIRSEDVKRYFEEAHRCYVYGFQTACAVLCRAILESALEEVIDPDRRIDRLLEIEAKKSGKPKQSYIGRLIDEAANKHILTDDRPECANEVRKAGNDAIHKPAQFEKRLRDPLRGIAYIIDSTRKVLIDLYSGGR